MRIALLLVFVVAPAACIPPAAVSFRCSSSVECAGGLVCMDGTCTGAVRVDAGSASSVSVSAGTSASSLTAPGSTSAGSSSASAHASSASATAASATSSGTSAASSVGASSSSPVASSSSTASSLGASSAAAASSSVPAASSGPSCGNGQADPGEPCDDGNSNNADSCTNTCVAASCGDGFVHAGVEACDDGASNGDTPGACSVDCTERLSCSGLDVRGARWTIPGTEQQNAGPTLTVETWIQLGASAPGVYRVILGKHECGVASGFHLGLSSDQPMAYTGGSLALAPQPLALGQWYHLAAVVEGAALRLYVDGVQVATASATNAVNTLPWAIGGCSQEGNFAGVVPLHAVLDELRVSSVARYTGTFRPAWRHAPQADTRFHLRADDTGTELRDSAGTRHLPLGTTAALVPSSSCQVFGGCGAVNLAGTEGAVATGSQALHLDNAHTLEAWIRPDPGYNVGVPLVLAKHDCGSVNGWFVGFSGGVFYAHAGVVAADVVSVDPGRWMHVATTYDRSLHKVFINGVLIGQRFTTALVNNNLPVVFGRCSGNPLPGVGALVGMVDQVRLSSAVRYTGNFTPPRRLALDDQTAGLWHFDEGSGTSSADVSPNAFNATVPANAAWAATCAAQP